MTENAAEALDENFPHIERAPAANRSDVADCAGEDGGLCIGDGERGVKCDPCAVFDHAEQPSQG